MMAGLLMLRNRFGTVKPKDLIGTITTKNLKTIVPRNIRDILNPVGSTTLVRA